LQQQVTVAAPRIRCCCSLRNVAAALRLVPIIILPRVNGACACRPVPALDVSLHLRLTGSPAAAAAAAAAASDVSADEDDGASDSLQTMHSKLTNSFHVVRSVGSRDSVGGIGLGVGIRIHITKMVGPRQNYHHQHQFNTHECSMNKKTHSVTHTK